MITLTVKKVKLKGGNFADLAWSGATSSVDVFKAASNSIR